MQKQRKRGYRLLRCTLWLQTNILWVDRGSELDKIDLSTSVSWSSLLFGSDWNTWEASSPSPAHNPADLFGSSTNNTHNQPRSWSRKPWINGLLDCCWIVACLQHRNALQRGSCLDTGDSGQNPLCTPRRVLKAVCFTSVSFMQEKRREQTACPVGSQSDPSVPSPALCLLSL